MSVLAEEFSLCRIDQVSGVRGNSLVEDGFLALDRGVEARLGATTF